jgi:hypothetical protein
VFQRDGVPPDSLDRVAKAVAADALPHPGAGGHAGALRAYQHGYQRCLFIRQCVSHISFSDMLLTIAALK